MKILREKLHNISAFSFAVQKADLRGNAGHRIGMVDLICMELAGEAELVQIRMAYIK